MKICEADDGTDYREVSVVVAGHEFKTAALEEDEAKDIFYEVSKALGADCGGG